MKNLRVFSLAILFVLPLILGTGCQMFSDLFGWSDPQNPNSIPPPAIEDPELPDGWTPPGEGVGERLDEWKKRPDLKLPTIYFSYDKFSIGAREKNILDQVAAYMQKSPKLGLIIEGHCDERGSDEYNRALGERRALAVHDYLVTIGIPSDRIQTQSFGEERPAVEGTGEAVYSKNRRAELILANMR